MATQHSASIPGSFVAAMLALIVVCAALWTWLRYDTSSQPATDLATSGAIVIPPVEGTNGNGGGAGTGNGDGAGGTDGGVGGTGDGGGGDPGGDGNDTDPPDPPSVAITLGMRGGPEAKAPGLWAVNGQKVSGSDVLVPPNSTLSVENASGVECQLILVNGPDAQSRVLSGDLQLEDQAAVTLSGPDVDEVLTWRCDTTDAPESEQFTVTGQL